MSTHDLLARLTTDLADTLPKVDAEVEHDRFDVGIGPFEEERQVKLLVERLRETDPRSDGFYDHVRTEVRYPNAGRSCDIVVEPRVETNQEGLQLPIEVKLLRFRRDNADRDPYRYKNIFSPFGSNTMMSDAEKLVDSGFDSAGALLGLYYERKSDRDERMNARRLAEKVELDIDYWFEFEAEVVAVSDLVELRHPIFERGAVVTWKLVDPDRVV